jgi:RNA polymerase sigma factor (sigma-70 family)
LDTVNANIIDIIDRCCSNERSGQKELYILLNEYAFKICYRYTNKAEEAEELVSEGFIKLFKNIGRFEVNRYPDTVSALKGWFKRILINTCIDAYRKNHNNAYHQQLADDSSNLQDHSASGLDMLSYKEIIEAIRLLSPSYRTVFNLFVIEGMSHEQISEQMGISVGASKSNLSKARENLRKILLKKNSYKAYA